MIVSKHVEAQCIITFFYLVFMRQGLNLFYPETRKEKINHHFRTIKNFAL